MALARIVTLLPRLMADSSILVLIPHPNKQLGQWEMGGIFGVVPVLGGSPWDRGQLGRRLDF